MNFIQSFLRDRCNNLGYGPFISLVDENGEFYTTIELPKNKMMVDTPHEYNKESNKIVVNLPNYNYLEHETRGLFRKELSTLWLNIPIEIKTNPKAEKIYDLRFFNQNDSTRQIEETQNSPIQDLAKKFGYLGYLSLIRRINVKINDIILFSWDTSTYLLHLADLFGDKFEAIFYHLFMPFNLNDYDSNTFHKNKHETIKYFRLPIFFYPPLKTWLLESSNTVEIFLKNSYTFEDNNECVSDFSMALSLDIKAILCYLNVNDKNFFDQKLKIKNFVQHRIDYEESNYYLFDKPSIIVDTLLKKPIRSMIFDFYDKTFDGSLFFGSTIDESIKNFLSSCLLYSNSYNKPSCFSFNQLCFPNGTNEWENYSISLFQKNSIIIHYKNDYSTIVYLNDSSDITKLPYLFDVNLIDKLKIYWFKSIRLKFSPLDVLSDEIDTSIVEENAFKIKNGYFYDNDSKKCFRGVENYKFNMNIIETDFVTQISKRLSQKHFDIMFSLPVTDNYKLSKFILPLLVRINDSNWRWMDLDRKYLWRINTISLRQNGTEGITKTINLHNLAVSNLNPKLFPLNNKLRPNVLEYQVFDMTPYQFFSSCPKFTQRQGYFNFEDYQMTLELFDSSFLNLDFKKENLFLRILYSTIKPMLYNGSQLIMENETFLSANAMDPKILEQLKEYEFMDETTYSQLNELNQ